MSQTPPESASPQRTPVDFGDVRAAFARPTHEEQWSHLVWILGRAQPDQRFEEEVLEYCRNHFEHWPHHVERQIPQRWLEEWWRDGKHGLLGLATSVNATASDYGHILGKRLAEDPDMSQMATLYLWGNRLGELGLGGLCEGEWPFLRTLVIGGNGIGRIHSGGATLRAPVLTHLNISHNPKMAGFLRSALNQETCLKRLELDVTSPTVADLKTLAKSGARRTLTLLSMSATQLPKKALPILFGGAPWPELDTLIFLQQTFDEERLRALFKAELPALTRLEMAGSYLSNRDLSQLLGAPWAPQLRVLSIGGNQFDDDAVDLLISAAPELQHMWKLQMSNCLRITPAAKQRLRNSVFAEQCPILEV